MRTYTKFKYLCSICCLIIIQLLALYGVSNAQVQGDFGRLSGKFADESSQMRSSFAPRYERVKVLNFAGKIPGVGRFQAELFSKRNLTWSRILSTPYGDLPDETKVLLLRGKIRIGRTKAQSNVAATLHQENNDVVVKLTFQSKRSQARSINSFYSVSFNIPKSSLGGLLKTAVSKTQLTRVIRLPQFALENKSCGTKDAHGLGNHVVAANIAKMNGLAATSNPSTNNLPTKSLPAVTRISQMSIEGDYEWVVANGSSSATASAEITNIVNAAEAIYERDLGITYDIVVQRLITAPGSNYANSQADQLLEEFQNRANINHQLGSADVYTLISGKRFGVAGQDGLYTIGLAYVGFVCAAPDYSYGIISKVSAAIDYITYAHEVGHNFGATHDNNSNSVMSPVAAAGQNQFSDFSKGEINTHLQRYGSVCLQSYTAQPTPVPGTTPTPIPTVSTPGGGGGSGGGNNGNGLIRSVALGASLSKSGLFKLTFEGGGDLSDACTVQITASTDSWFKTKTVLYSAVGSTPTFALTGRVAKRAISSNAKKKSATQFYLREEYTCPATAQFEYSGALRLNPGSISSRSSAVTVKRWITLLAKALS